MTPEELKAHSCMLVEQIGKDLFDDPEDDWPPLLLLLLPNGQLTPALFDGRFLAGDDEKNLLAATMHKLILDNRATAAAFVSSCWYVDVAMTEEWKRKVKRGEVPKTHDDLDMVMPRDHPARIEQVVVMLVEPFFESTLAAKIERHDDKPPTLGEWKTMHELLRDSGVEQGPDDAEYTDGRFVNPLREAIMQVAEQKMGEA